ncbi:MAG TPA: enoyl-CoA hydratase [Terriglobia bacterium]|nr:enoyl-CoA hydratase [Terriglobia bacterium]
MADEPVVVTQEGAVATILLNRPDKLNAIDEGVRGGLAAALLTVAHEPSIRVAVLTGAGRGFCAGGDIRTMVELKQNHQSAVFRSYLEAGHEVVRSIRRMPKMVIAAVNGPAAGAGMNLALACDLRIASDQANFSQAFVSIGLHPDWGGTFFVPRMVGIGRAIEILALGDAIPADEAHRWGLVNFLVPAATLGEETRKLATRLAAAPSLPLALLKQALFERLETEMDRMMEHEVDAQMKCFDSDDFGEGITAFLEKRKPHFKGR